jgi:hypothetical protein
MLAHHPLTGKPIKIMKTETHLYKNQKTLMWLRQQPGAYKDAHRYARWESILSDISYLAEWKETLGVDPTAILIREGGAHIHTWFQTSAPKTRTLLFLSKDCMSSYGMERFTQEGFQNVICLEEMGHMFPHCGYTYQTSDSDARIVHAIGVVLRVARIFGFSENELQDEVFQMAANDAQTKFGVQAGPTATPEECWLIQQYFISPKPRRDREIRSCLEDNIANPFIDKILLLNEQDYIMRGILPRSNKIVECAIGCRLQYAEVFKTIQGRIPSGAIVAFANSDIVFDNTIRQVWSLNMKDVCLSLLRYEEPTVDGGEPTLFGPRPDSQDSWIVHSDSVKSRTWDWKSLSFEFGRAGCDNAIGVELLRQKFIVANPALSIRTLHRHASQVRTYNPHDCVDKSVYLYVDPTGLHDLEPKAALTSYQVEWPTAKPFSRRVYSADERQLKTFCRMVSREEKFIFEPTSENQFVPQQDETAYSFKHAFTTPNGLVYDYKSVFVGQKPVLREAWSKTNISTMTPGIGVKSILAAPLDDSVASNAFSYLQMYLGRILRMKEQGFSGDMWMPRDCPRLQECLQFFKWEEQLMPVIPRDPDIVSYSEKATMLTPRANDVVYQEDVEALRNKFRPYKDEPIDSKRVVIFQEEGVLHSEDVLAIESALEDKGYFVNIVYPTRSSASFMFQRIVGSAVCITGPKQEYLYWMLPRGAQVMELMPELEIRGEGVHVAGAASLEAWVSLIPRADPVARRKMIVEKVLATLQAATTKISVGSVDTKPLVIVPTNWEGFHAHSGDTFREMVAIWEAKGLVRVERSNQTPYCWLGGIGETLLYDRPTFDWLKHTPATYKRILCGNPDASQVSNGIQWTFWPRKPELVEQVAAEQQKSFDERKDTLVFYGKIENDVQRSHRTNALWEACDEFTMPVGANKEYKFSQEEYLKKLGDARFGLCLAGFGPKCNREIECFALGTVPVVAPDVDMEKYANPPQEGVHYIRLKSFKSEDAKSAVDSVSKERWEEMSAAARAWWKTNASAEGMWALTARLGFAK